MVQSFLNIFTYFFKQYNNPIIQLCFGIFAATVIMYFVRELVRA